MWNILSDIVDAGAVSDAGSESGKPSNSNQNYFTNGETMIIILVAIFIAILLFFFFYIYNKNKEMIEIIKSPIDKTINDNEKQILLNYRKLNDKDKHIIENTIKSLNDKGQL